MSPLSSKIAPFLLATCAVLLVAADYSKMSPGLRQAEMEAEAQSKAQDAVGNTHGVVGLQWKHGAIYPTITSVAAGSAGEQAKISPGDKLLAIDDKCTSFLCGRQVIWMLRGPIGQPVKLELMRADNTKYTVSVKRCDPTKLPNAADADALSYKIRPADVDQPPKYPDQNPNFVSETPWLLTSEGGAIVEFYDDKSGQSKTLPTLSCSFQPPGHPKISYPDPLITRLSFADATNRDFASKFGISQAPAYIFVAPIVPGMFMPKPGIELDPLHNTKRRLLPRFSHYCIGQEPWTATPGKF